MQPLFNNPIDGYSIVFSLDQNYLRPALTLMHSIKTHAADSEIYNFFILHEDIPPFCQKIVAEYAQILDVYVRFINISQMKINGPVSSHFSKAMYFRLLIPALFKEWENILYMDVDILALSNITPLFKTLQEGNAFAASKEDFISFIFPGYIETVLKSGQITNYFGSGLILFNCKNISEKEITDSLKAIGKYTRCPDQDILNHVYEGRVNFIPRQLHFVLIDGKWQWDGMSDELLKKRQKIQNPTLIHYAGGLKPWSKDLLHNPDGYGYYEEYQRQKQVTDKQLNEIFLAEAQHQFP